MDLTPFGALGVACIVIAAGVFALVVIIARHLQDDSDVIR